ncbi:MAG: protoheme IX farnesyltransferase, partial [Nitrospinaceae bacterium]|nr:protoheme IX farnesyltransferase [Nitrospinaceae bacterium]
FSSLLLGLMYLASGIQLARKRTVDSARHLFWVSLLYLPLVYLIMVLDHGTF